MGLLGWSPAEADAMEVWQVGMFLGPNGSDPVIRGARQLSTRSDTDGPGKPPADRTLAARIARQKRLEQEREAGP
jgi:hypothetical protein